MNRNHRKMINDLIEGIAGPSDISASDIQDAVRDAATISADEIRAEVNALSLEQQEALIRPFIGVPFPPDDQTLRVMLQELESNAIPECVEETVQFHATVDTILQVPGLSSFDQARHGSEPPGSSNPFGESLSAVD